MDDRSYYVVPTREAQGRSGTKAAAGLLALTGIAAATWLYFRKADPSLEERTRARLAPRSGREG